MQILKRRSDAIYLTEMDAFIARRIIKQQPVHRLEYKTRRKGPAAAVTMHDLASELFPEWQSHFSDVLTREVRHV